MSIDSHMFQYLKERVDKGFPAPDYPDLLQDGDYLYVPKSGSQAYKNSVKPTTVIAGKSAKCRVAFFFDGPFLPVRNGACYTIYNLMRALGEASDVEVSFFNCYRGWDKIDDYCDKEFSSTFVTPNDFYEDTGVLEKAMADQAIQVAHFIDNEGLAAIGPRLRQQGIKIVLDSHNIDCVLLKQLGLSDSDVTKAADAQRQAHKLADFNLFRSQFDLDWGVKLGASAQNSALCKGGIRVEDISFVPRRGTKKLLLLGHMYYQPNENGLHQIATNILPELDADYNLTVIGAAPPKLIELYNDRPNVFFKQGVDDLDSSLQAYDIALAPLLEGSGTRLKILDYLASGLPVIATNVAVEGLDPRINTYMTIEDDISAYAQHIRSLSDNLEAARRKSHQGRVFVEQEYDWSNCLQPYVYAYHKSIDPNIA